MALPQKNRGFVILVKNALKRVFTSDKVLFISGGGGGAPPPPRAPLPARVH